MSSKNTIAPVSFAFAPGFARLLAVISTGTLLAACSGADIASEGESTETSDALATVYQVGPTRTYKDLGQLATRLQPGDVVEVDGNATYPALKLTSSGTALAKVTIRGLPVNGKRPVFSGGTNAVEVSADHYILEGLDITGGAARCFFHHGDDVTLRDSVVHDCAMHGILGADSESGSLTLDYVEVHHAGAGTQNHSIYMATDETAHPGAVFRMQHCYVHDTNGGNAVKSRAERNEIYYNWIEGGYYKELELIGPDGQDPSLAREDSDVVGNVFRKTRTQFVVRVGGDGTGDTDGRYRFVNNTFILAQGSAAAFQLFDGIESIEMHNNVFYRQGGGGVTILDDSASWTTGSPIIVGTKNFVSAGSRVPSQWNATMARDDVGFTNLSSLDVRPVAASPLVNAGNVLPVSPAGHAVPSPLVAPLYLPPSHGIEAMGAAQSRVLSGAVDVGAFEYAESTTTTPPPPPPPSGGSCASAAVNEWKNGSFAAKTGTFTASFDVTPSALGIDSGVGLSSGVKSTAAGLAAVVAFNPAGAIVVRRGDNYTANTTLNYKAGTSYHVRMVVDLSQHLYSVYVTPAGAAEVKLASSYSFRTEQAAVTSLDSWDLWNLTSNTTLQVCNVSVQ